MFCFLCCLLRTNLSGSISRIFCIDGSFVVTNLVYSSFEEPLYFSTKLFLCNSFQRSLAVVNCGAVRLRSFSECKITTIFFSHQMFLQFIFDGLRR